MLAQRAPEARIPPITKTALHPLSVPDQPPNLSGNTAKMAVASVKEER